MNRTIFEIPKMDCASEEYVVRNALEKSNGVRKMEFDLGARCVSVEHEDESGKLLVLLEPLGLDARILNSREFSETPESLILSNKNRAIESALESKVLKKLLAINGVMFALELFLGFYAQSTGLLADSLDMFADAAVYGLSLYAVGRSAGIKTKAARLSGYMQILLALGAGGEVIRRSFYGSDPEGGLMMGVAALALFANVTCMMLLSRHRHGGVHMKASWIFSTNDVIANMGVIVAGLLVLWSKSNWPDLIVGLAIAAVVFRGGLRIIRGRLD